MTRIFTDKYHLLPPKCVNMEAVGYENGNASKVNGCESEFKKTDKYHPVFEREA